MIGKIALKYFRTGFNCSQCILKACDDFFGLNLDKSCFDMLKCVSNGFGIGSLCSILSAGVMVLGLMFEENKVKSLRIRFLTEATEALDGTSCPEIRRNMKSPGGCERAVETAGDLLEEIIKKRKKFFLKAGKHPFGSKKLILPRRVQFFLKSPCKNIKIRLKL